MDTTALLRKLNYKGHDPVLVIRPPEAFAPAVEALAREATVHQDAAAPKGCAFVIAFATRQQQVDELAKQVAPALEGDAILWIAYPKQSSKRYRCEFNRDTGWDALGPAGYEPVRQVAIDEDWSALRFRRVAHIKKMTRSFAMTAEGKAKAAKGKG
ncbi:MAG: hypothetical protein ACK4L7_06555 [Flavobacteriales bacterium]